MGLDIRVGLRVGLRVGVSVGVRVRARARARARARVRVSIFVYPAAAVVVVHDVARDTQRHFRLHEDDVLCVATAWCRGLGLGLGLGQG